MGDKKEIMEEIKDFQNLENSDFEKPENVITEDTSVVPEIMKVPKKRGRKPGQKNKPKSTSVNSAKSTQFDDIFSDVKNNLDPDAASVSIAADDDSFNANTSTNTGGSNYSGKSLVALTDLVFSMIASLSVRIISKGEVKVPVSNFKADSMEKEILEEFGNDAADEILGNVNPTFLYFTMAVALYGSRAYDQYELYKSNLKNSSNNSL